MLKIYSTTSYVSIDGSLWSEVGLHNEYVALNEPPENKLVFRGISFDELYEYLSHNYLCGLKKDVTLFRSKPLIWVQYSDAFDPVSYRHFNNLLYKTEFRECDNLSLDWIMKNLSADECIQYLKDRGMTACPILK